MYLFMYVSICASLMTQKEESACNAVDTRDMGSIPGSGRCPGRCPQPFICLSIYVSIYVCIYLCFPDDSERRIHLQCSRHKRYGFDPWVRKMPWRREWQLTPIFFAWGIPWTEEPGGLLYHWSCSWCQLSHCISLCALFAEPRVGKGVSWEAGRSLEEP